ncbi:MAG TPA: toprim domain-containing protein [Candidatus Paceibacterota bacterium]|nr:toprim domain-containing protein [Candidatus Paceibacterota bacterium]
MDKIEALSQQFAKFPGIGPRQARRFVFYLLAAPAAERAALAELVASLSASVHQCPECLRFYTGSGSVCGYCADKSRDDTLLMVVEKDQDLAALERAGTYKGRYFVLGGVLTLSGKGAIRERELAALVKRKAAAAADASPGALREIILALSATSEGEHTADRVRELLAPLRDSIKVSALGRGLATGSELEYADSETLRAALAGRSAL